MNLGELFGRFPRLFWVVNAIELFERGAYYGMLAVLPYHLVYNLHFPTTAFGVLLGILTPFLYLLPIISGSLVEKYGFRPMLVLALALVIIGYLASSFMTTFEAFVLAFVVFGTGVGTFKPIISASIAHTTAPEARNLGYSIYYWMINLGSFSMPIIISIFIPKQDYVYVFYLSAALIAVNIALALLVFRNPVPPNPEKSVADVFKGAALVLKDLRFLALLFIYSGFWFMYATNHLALLLFALDFGVLGDWFPPALVAIVNPGTIIFLGPFLGKFFGKYDSLKVMVLGMGIFIAGLLVLGLTTVAAIFFIGIVIFSIGEFVTHPTYIAYVSKIAPKERLTVYMAYAFIPPLIGLSAGNVLGAVAYAAIAEGLHRPKLFWSAIAAVGFATIAALLLYSQFIGRKATEEGQPERTPTDGEKRPFIQEAFWSRWSALACLAVIPLLVGGAFGGGMDRYYRDGGNEDADPWSRYTLVTEIAGGDSGHSTENSDTALQEEVPGGNMVNVTFTLTWTDEPDIRRVVRVYANQPDEFGLEVAAPNGTVVSSPMVKNAHGAAGSVSVSIPLDPGKPGVSNNPGPFDVTVKCGVCGDLTNPISATMYTDTGNDWELEISHTYYTRK